MQDGTHGGVHADVQLNTTSAAPNGSIEVNRELVHKPGLSTSSSSLDHPRPEEVVHAVQESHRQPAQSQQQQQPLDQQQDTQEHPSTRIQPHPQLAQRIPQGDNIAPDHSTRAPFEQPQPHQRQHQSPPAVPPPARQSQSQSQPPQKATNPLPALPHELLLLLCQAVYAHDDLISPYAFIGTALDPASAADAPHNGRTTLESFEGVSRLLLKHPATARRTRSLLTPTACMGYYTEIVRHESIDSAPAGLNGTRKANVHHIHLRLVRKSYERCLTRVRHDIGKEEVQMRTLTKEIEDIQNGAWDDVLTRPYILLHLSADPTMTRYGRPKTFARPRQSPTQSHSFHQLQQPSAQGNSGNMSEPTSTGRTSSPSGLQAVNTPKPPQSLPDRPTAAPLPPAPTQSGPTELLASRKRIHEETPLNAANALVPQDESEAASAPSLSEATRVINGSKVGSPTASSEEISQLQLLRSNLIKQEPGRAVDSDGRPDDFEPPQERSDFRQSPEYLAHDEITLPYRNKRKRTLSRSATPTSSQYDSSEEFLLGDDDLLRSKRIKTEDIDSPFGTPSNSDSNDSESSSARRFRNAAPHLIQRLQSSPHSTYFKDPVRRGEALNYLDVVKSPMDLRSLSQHVKTGTIASGPEFTRDLALIFANAVMYNGEDNPVADDAMAMWTEAQELVRVLEAAEQRLA